ncbi:MAG TPA: hypothetical protein VGT79_05615 [Xanthomonadaceae bacterium]|nr:hypothetical protein [Xanthomonadaceae bacterium]
MRRIVLLTAIALLPCALPARADGVLYRCESDAGISIQGTPCPKGGTQRKIAVQPPANAVPVPVPQAPAVPAAPAAAMPITPSSAMRGPNDPYPLWQCMRADGSTFDSRTGVPGKQWVPKPDDPDAAANTPPKIAVLPKKGDHIIRPYVEADVPADAPAVDSTPPPPGAAPGQWVADQCTLLDPQQACDRFATRRDALRKQIYAAKPSERATWAPEEQDLTSMLYAACGR